MLASGLQRNVGLGSLLKKVVSFFEGLALLLVL
jgi:hypothetical protein